MFRWFDKDVLMSMNLILIAKVMGGGGIQMEYVQLAVVRTRFDWIAQQLAYLLRMERGRGKIRKGLYLCSE